MNKIDNTLERIKNLLISTTAVTDYFNCLVAEINTLPKETVLNHINLNGVTLRNLLDNSQILFARHELLVQSHMANVRDFIVDPLDEWSESKERVEARIKIDFDLLLKNNQDLKLNMEQILKKVNSMNGVYIKPAIPLY